MTGEGGQKTLDALAYAIAANRDVLAHLKAPSRRNKCHIANLLTARAGN